MTAACFYLSPIGPIKLVEDNGALIELTFSRGKPSAPKTLVLKETMRQLEAYFAGRLGEFGLPLSPRGTDFQLSVWRALLQIPYGEVRSYRDMAGAVGNPKACRAVGMASHNNPISIIIPCHRVVGANGGLVGYGGGLEVKRKLLELESVGLQT